MVFGLFFSHLEFWIVRGSQTALEVGILSFPKSGHIVERDGEDGRLAADLLHGPVVTLLVFQRLDLLQRVHSLGQLRVEDEAGLGQALEGGPGAVLAHLVDGPALVDAAILLVTVEDVQDDDAKVVEGAESVARRQFGAVAVPLDHQERVVDGRQTGLEVGALSLHQTGNVRQLGDEFGVLRGGGHRGLFVDRLVFQGPDLGQRVRLERVRVDASLADAAQSGPGEILAKLVAGLTNVLAGIVGLDVGDVQHDETKVRHRLDARRMAQRLAVNEPFNLDTFKNKTGQLI